MKVLYLIRHSIKEKECGINDSHDSRQIKDEKRILSIEGEQLALKLSQLKELQDIDEIWCSNYVRTIQTAKYISKNKLKLNISTAFDERYYGDMDLNINKQEFWIKQFIDPKLKCVNGESQEDVRKRMENKINDLLDNSLGKKIAIITHNACTLFYLLKYCELIDAKVPKKLTIKYQNKILIQNDIMKSPSIMKLEFDGRNLLNITYLDI